MQIKSFWNAWIMNLNIKIIFNEKAIHVHLKYMNYDHKHSNNISLIQLLSIWNAWIMIKHMKIIFH